MAISKLTLMKMKYLFWTLPIIPLGIMFVVVMVASIPHACYRLPHSMCFKQGDLNYAAFLARNRAQERFKLAMKYYERVVNESILPYEYARGIQELSNSSIDHPSVVVAILAKNRNNREKDHYLPHYLTQSTYSLISTLDRDMTAFGRRWRNVNITICNLDQDAEAFFEARYLTALFSFQYYAYSTNPNTKRCPKEVRQLHHCLESIKTKYPKTDFLVLAEDDMIVQTDFWSELWDLTTSKIPLKIHNKFGYIQLHTPMHKYVYAVNDASTWLEIIFIAGSCTCFILFIYLRLVLRAYNILHNVCVVGFTFSTFAVVVLIVGRPHWLSGVHQLTRVYRLGEPTTPGFSAVLANMSWASRLAQEITSLACTPAKNLTKLELMQAFVGKNKEKVWAIYPSLFRHIGLYSDYVQDIINPYLLDD